MYYSTVLVTRTSICRRMPGAGGSTQHWTLKGLSRHGIQLTISSTAVVSSLLCSPLLSSPLVYRLHDCVRHRIACAHHRLHAYVRDCMCASQRGTAGTAAAAVMDGGFSGQDVASHRFSSWVRERGGDALRLDRPLSRPAAARAAVWRFL